ncbi:MAG: aminopeptidase N [Gammaproteobacteria bacterium]
MLLDSGPRTVVQRQDYTPPPYLIDTTSLCFSLGEKATEVTARLALRRNPAAEAVDPLILDGIELELLDIRIDAAPLAPERYQTGEHGLVIHAPPEKFELTTQVRIHPETNAALSGLYKSSGNFCTQCEAEGFRRITYYLDRPDVLARFDVRIEADRARYPVLLSNGNRQSSGEMDGGRHYAEWHDPFPKPSYLFALVAGDLACLEGEHRTASGRTVPLRLYVEAHNRERAHHALASLQRAMTWDEQCYGREYDLDTFMIVAVDDFNMGAMENKGLNIFNSKYVLADPDIATDQDYASIEAVIGHEYFHNWTGDRVTCRDWFQLSLKEGLTVFREQSFSAEMTSSSLKRIEEVRFLRQFQFAEDAGPIAHPVRPDQYIEINNFYTATVYEKGAEVVRMYRTLLGSDGFRKGMDLYFERHDGQAVTTDDFLAAMADANGADLSQFARWYSVAGTPCLRVRGHYDAEHHTYTLELGQIHGDSPGQPAGTKPTLLIPVAISLLDADGNAMPLTLKGKTESATVTERTLWLRESRETFVLTGISAPPVPSLLRGFSAPVKLEFDYSDEELAFLIRHDSDAFCRWDNLQTLIARTVARHIERGEPDAASIQRLSAALASLLDQSDADPALVAEMLTLPSEASLALAYDEVNVEALHTAHEYLRTALAGALEDRLITAFEQTRSTEPYHYDPALTGRRRLHNAALDLLGALHVPQHLVRAEKQFDAADNMTDRLAALHSLSEQDGPEAKAANRSFRERYDTHPLVLDKWFALHATRGGEDSVERVRNLMTDPVFTLKNPNRVRALLGAFAQHNHAGFHRADGAGYRFIADQVLAIDAFNPQVAARLVKCFARWRRYDSARQEKIRTELERMLAAESLSTDVYEIVQRALT